MAYIPENAKWYLATMVEEISVEGDSSKVVHKNYMLIRGESPEDAYYKAQELGKKSDVSYDNPAGRLVQITFKGLSELNVIHDELEHGAELLYEELIGLSEDQIEALVRPKEALGVFQPVCARGAPDYSSKEVSAAATRLMDAEAGGTPGPTGAQR